MNRFDEFVKSRQIPFSVIPADPGSSPGGIQAFLDPSVPRGDNMKDFLQLHQSLIPAGFRFNMHINGKVASIVNRAGPSPNR
jgi:hypothetical protein